MLGFQAHFDLLHFLLSLYRATYIYFIACRIHNYICHGITSARL